MKPHHDLIKAHIIAALAALVISALFGLAVSLKMHMPELMSSQPFLTWGRMRYDHTQGIFFGWLGNAFLAFLYYAVPHLAQRQVFSKLLGWTLFALWNVGVVLLGWGLVLAGFSQPLEWAEFPLIVDFAVVVALALSIVQFVIPLMKLAPSKLYVSGWYILGGMVFTLLAYPVGNLVPELVPGAQGAAFSGLWIHDAIGLYVTPLALAIAYFTIPIITGRPIYSHFLSLVGFWLLFFVYPLNGTHHYVFSAIPMDAQQGAIIASVILGFDVILVVTNLLVSLRGAGEFLKKDPALRFVREGILFYLLVSIQGSGQAIMGFNKQIHFTDWVIGHSHLAMIGFASFLAIGGVALAWRNLPNQRFNPKMLWSCYWLMLAGLLLMVFDLSALGPAENMAWSQNSQWIESHKVAKPYWIIRSVAGTVLFSGCVCLLLSFFTGKKNEAVSDEAIVNEEALTFSTKDIVDIRQIRAVNMVMLSTFAAGVGMFVVSFVILGVVPGLAMQKQLEKTTPPSAMPLTAEEQRGRIVYAREGCAYCHTQQVRVLAADTRRFGAPTRVWETQYDYPQLWGTRRIGPDLAREAGIRSDDWQLAHLYNPRSVVEETNMPAFPWLFKKAPDQPTQECLDLLAYLKTLGKARQLGDVATVGVSDDCLCPEDVKALEALAFPMDVSPNTARRQEYLAFQTTEEQPFKLVRSDTGTTATGNYLFNENCAGCHGKDGAGNGEAAPGLLPAPANLQQRKLSRRRIEQALTAGVPGTAMPAWRNLPSNDVFALVEFVQTLGKSERVSAKKVEADHEAKTLYKENCSSCHGTAGDGMGVVAPGLNRPPSDFWLVQPNLAYAEKVIAEGVPGSSMPPWKHQLSEKQRKMLAVYVRTFYRED